MTAALTRSNCVSVSVLSRVENCHSKCQWCRRQTCSMLTDQRQESFVDRRQQFWSAAWSGHVDRRVETVETGVIIDTWYELRASDDTCTCTLL